MFSNWKNVVSQINIISTKQTLHGRLSTTPRTDNYHLCIDAGEAKVQLNNGLYQLVIYCNQTCWNPSVNISQLGRNAKSIVFLLETMVSKPHTLIFCLEHVTYRRSTSFYIWKHYLFEAAQTSGSETIENTLCVKQKSCVGTGNVDFHRCVVQETVLFLSGQQWFRYNCLKLICLTGFVCSAIWAACASLWWIRWVVFIFEATIRTL